jgi:hypothetical protein
MTLPPIGKDTYDTFQFEWSEIGMGIGKQTEASGSGYMVASFDNLHCEPRGTSGADYHAAPIGDMQTAFPYATADPRLEPWSYMALSLVMQFYFYVPGAVRYVAPCQVGTINIQTYPVEFEMTIREGSPDGPIAIDTEGTPRQYIMSNSEVIQEGGIPHMGYRTPDNPWPQFFWKVESGFFHVVYPQLVIVATAGVTPPPPPPIPEPFPPPIAPPPSPPCNNLLVPSTVGLGDRMSGVVPMR